MPEPLKNMYDEAFFDTLIAAFMAAHPAFDGPGFRAAIYDAEWEDRALMDRMRHVAATLHAFLPDDYRTALDIIRRAAPDVPYGFQTMAFSEFVALYGLADWAASLPALEQLTQQCSAEFAVRPFLLADPARMMAQMRTWAAHPSEHVRRLASEGCRPRLPWGVALPAFKADPGPILPILDVLKDDPAEAVRRSVANNLNDISRDNPAVTLDVLRSWQAAATPEVEWITKHALRTLIKQGHPDALALLGFGPPAVRVTDLAVEPVQIAIGEDVALSFTVTAEGTATQDLVIDYIVHLVRANAKTTAKVFKLNKRTLAPGESITLRKKHSFQPVTTRRYYPGTHAIEVQINGQQYGRATFELTE